MTLQSEDMGKLVAGCGTCVYCAELGAPELCRHYDAFRPAHREAQPETDGGGEVLWGCADGNGVDERLVYRDKSRADGAALSLGLTVVPLYAKPTPEGQTEGEDTMALIYQLATKGADRAGCDGWRAQEICRQIAALASKGV